MQVGVTNGTIMYSFLKRASQICTYKVPSILISGMTTITLESSPDWEKDNETVSGVSEEIMATITKEEVKQLILSDKVVIFSKTGCPYCRMAKKVFDSMQEKYVAIELDEREDGSEIQTILGEMTGARTVPRVFVKGECLGGGTDVQKLYDNGQLQKML